MCKKGCSPCLWEWRWRRRGEQLGCWVVGAYQQPIVLTVRKGEETRERLSGAEPGKQLALSVSFVD